jgi:hypothetical protein
VIGTPPAPLVGFAPGREVTVVVTVSSVCPMITPDVAVIAVVPGPIAVVSPPAVIVATPGMVDAQVTALVRSCVELSEYTPVAVNCRILPVPRLLFAGVTVMRCNVGAGAPTVKVMALMLPPLSTVR